MYEILLENIASISSALQYGHLNYYNDTKDVTALNFFNIKFNVHKFYKKLCYKWNNVSYV